MKHTAAAFVVAFALALGAASNASATVPHYTGCLTDKGVFIGFEVGETPLGPCGDKATQAQLSAGDITRVDAGTGLEGGGVNGDVALDVAPTYRLPQSCATDQIAKWSGAVVVRERLQQHVQRERLRALESVLLSREGGERRRLSRRAFLRHRPEHDLQRRGFRDVEPELSVGAVREGDQQLGRAEL